MGNLCLHTIMLLAQLEVIILLVNSKQPIVYRILRASSLRFLPNQSFQLSGTIWSTSNIELGLRMRQNLHLVTRFIQ